METATSINAAYNRRHKARINSYVRRIEALFKAANRDVAALVVRSGLSAAHLTTDPFSFSKHPLAKKAFDELVAEVRKNLLAGIVNGVTAEWELANDKNDALADLVFSRLKGQLTDEEKQRYYRNNSDALEAYRNRVTAGLRLSDRVWKYTDQYKTEIEYALDCAIRDGVAANELATQLTQYLQYPDKLFRRVRDQYGFLHLSKAAAAFHPSTGVYRSSFKNARRLAATETNIAYRTSDHVRYQQLDFVVGIQIHLSNNHTCLGRDGKPHPFRDICDDLQGFYPKDFKYVGWHPHCRCFVTSVIMTDDEIDAARAARRAGRPIPQSKLLVKDVPQAFKTYVATHRAALERAANKPYWYRDNPKYSGYEGGESELAKIMKQE